MNDVLLRPAGTFERALIRSDQHAPFNVVGVLVLENPPAPALVRRSLEALMRRHPLLRSCLREGAFYALDRPELTFTCMARSGDLGWRAVVEQEMNTRLDVSTRSFQACYLYGGQRAELILTFNHAVLDAVSGTNLVDELLRGCAGMPELPALDVSPAAETRFPARFQGGRGWLRRLAYMASQMGEEIGYRWAMRGRPAASLRLGGRGFIDTLVLPEALVAALGRRCRRERVTLNSLLNAALLLALNRVVYGGQSLPMRTFSFADLRPYTVPPTPPEQLGSCTAMLRYTLPLSGQAGIWPLAARLHARIYRSLKSGGKFSATQLSEQVMRMLLGMKSSRMSSTALNFGGVVKLQPVYGDIRLQGLHVFNSSLDLGPEVASQARLFADQLWWDFMFLESDMDRSTAARVVAEAAAILQQAPEAV